MERYFWRLFILAMTFSFGIWSCIFYYFNTMPEVSNPDTETVEIKNVCFSNDLNNFPGLSKEIAEIRKGKSDFFPKNLFGNNLPAKDSQAGWYAKQLKAMGEKSLLDDSIEAKEVYRFLWLRSFHHPIFVRIERYGQYKTELFTKELGGAGGYEPGKSWRSGKFNIDEEQWKKFSRLLEKADYWKMSSENEDFGNDGAEWILEGVKESRYHVVDRWSPREGAYREACVYLLKISGVDVDKLKDDLY